MKILVVSDTHGRLDGFKLAHQLETPYDLLIHCGDLEGDEDRILELSGTPAFMVTGNNDFFSSLPPEREFMLMGKKALLTHGHHYYVYMDVSRLAGEASLRGASFAFFGHTHKPLLRSMNGVLLINPGSLSYPRQEGRLRSYITMEITEGAEPLCEIKTLNK